MTTKLELGALLAVLLICDTSVAVPPLEELLERAMHSNAEIVVARTQAELAKAQLSLVQMKVARETVALHSELTAQTEKIRLIRAQLKASQGGKDAMVSLIDAEAKLAEIQAHMLFLTGQSMPGRSVSGHPTAARPALEAARPLLQSPLGQKIRDALGETTSLEFVEHPLGEIGEYLSEVMEIPIVVDESVQDLPITLILEVPFAAATQSMEDVCPQVRFVIREYGILITSSEVAAQRQFLSVIDFWNLTAGMTKDGQTDPKPEAKGETPKK